jgi:allantoicase
MAAAFLSHSRRITVQPSGQIVRLRQYGHVAQPMTLGEANCQSVNLRAGEDRRRRFYTAMQPVIYRDAK